jgi:hypothetical protein
VPVRIVGIAAVLAVMALYCFYTAKRLDRLHRRMDAAAAGLEAHLRRRAVAALTLARSHELATADTAAVDTAVAETAVLSGLDHDREVAENGLSQLLADIALRNPALFLSPSVVAAEVHDDSLRATIARRFYNDTVRDALVVRDRRAVRWLGLAGRARHPAYFEMDDEELPAPRYMAESRLPGGPKLKP